MKEWGGSNLVQRPPIWGCLATNVIDVTLSRLRDIRHTGSHRTFDGVSSTQDTVEWRVKEVVMIEYISGITSDDYSNPGWTLGIKRYYLWYLGGCHSRVCNEINSDEALQCLSPGAINIIEHRQQSNETRFDTLQTNLIMITQR